MVLRFLSFEKVEKNYKMGRGKSLRDFISVVPLRLLRFVIECRVEILVGI